MSGRDEAPPPLLRLADELAADLMRLSDAELLAEVEAEGLDPDQEADRVREAILMALAQRGKARLKAALSAVEAARSPSSVARGPLRVQDRRAVLARFANDDDKLRQRMTMAARNAKGITDQEIDSILEDLRDLGAIDDDGNPT